MERVRDTEATNGGGGVGQLRASAALALAPAGIEEVEVTPQMTAAARRQGTQSTTDPADALAIGRVGARDQALPRPRPDGAKEEPSSLFRYR